MTNNRPLILTAGIDDELEKKFASILSSNEYRTDSYKDPSALMEGIKSDYPEILILNYNSNVFNAPETASLLKTSSKTKRFYF